MGKYAALPLVHVWDSVPVVVPTGSTWRNQVTPRFGLSLARHRPVARARRIQQPFLIQVLEDETVLPVPPMRKAARRAPRGRAISYSGLDHFDIYVGDGFERLVEDQLLFLNDVVGQPI